MSTNNETDVGTRVMDLLIMLLEDQTGETYQYERIDNQSTEEKTA